ncbi:hypothetical protein CP985_09060 [Malaciobacter mytili LMG 24559]|uniref:Lipoprotein n=1 Tax=Malaciobacter mytili LMG 24559 TaxID=1032238 RepID=A0AAX2AGM2_9BACT|nr:hypothetical protein [Malaciobacter mytili]AXH14258.1 hypothetical protein AMYT_0664 [Malaciobacter mytili LMG 24559]RXK15300.1 hypothetical protein CP985_09060 [Malaciobacter mytili LMG 24559]
MKKLVLLIIALVAVFSGCVATNENGEKGLKGVYTGHIYTKQDLNRYKEIYNDGKHIVLQVKEEVNLVKQSLKETE